MTTKITIIIDAADPTAFEEAYPGLLAAARKLPDLQRVEAGKVWPKEDGSPTPAHRTLDLYFDDYDAASAATATPEAGALFGGLAATGASITGLFSDVEQD
jgi:hypothetical protein